MDLLPRIPIIGTRIIFVSGQKRQRTLLKFLESHVLGLHLAELEKNSVQSELTLDENFSCLIIWNQKV